MPTETAISGFVWNDQTHRWRNLATGRFISQAQMTVMRDTFLDRARGLTDGLTQQMYDGKLRSGQWAVQMRQTVRATYIDQYAAARGGIGNLGPADLKALSGMLNKQWDYLLQFQQDLNAGKLSLGQAQARARMYVESASQAFERGKTASYGMPDLPAYPGDGQTVCRANCRCHWQIEDVGNAWACSWKLGAAEHCPDCIGNAGHWNPLMLTKGA